MKDCKDCDNTRVAHWEGANGEWKMACPGCCGYIDYKDNNRAYRDGVEYVMDWDEVERTTEEQEADNGRCDNCLNIILDSGRCDCETVYIVNRKTKRDITKIYMPP